MLPRRGWGAFCQGIPTEGKGKSEEKEMHINILELKVVKLALMSFHKQMKMKAVHFQINKTTALMYLLKMEGTGNKRLLDLAKDIWDYILKDGIAITAEYLPSCLKGQFRVGPSSPNISSNLPNKRDSRDNLVCIPAVTSASKILCLETGSIQSGYRCNAASVGK